MNPQWDDGRRWQEVKPQHLKSILKKVPKPADDWHQCSQSPGQAVHEPSTMLQGFAVGQQRHDPVTDGVGLEVERVDVELARKRKELEEIEERIMHKKVAIALKQAKPLVESLSSGFYAGIDHSNSLSLRNRVHQILQQQHPAGFLSQTRSLKDRRNATGSSMNGLLPEQHPLKIRVKELMKYRRCHPCPPERAVTDVNPSSATQPPADGSVNMGFQRFLTVLNKGVDMDLLTKIVNDGCGVVDPVETALNHKPPAVVAEPSIPPSNGGKQSDSRDGSRTDSGSHSLGSSSRSRSPPVVSKKQKEEEKATEQQEQMQNILKTLGLNLEVGEISRLANRTQERLYGTKHDNTNSDHQKKLLGQPRKHRNSSSRSSSSASSYSGYDSSRSSSRSVSPPCNRFTRSKDSLLRNTSKSLKGTEELPKPRVQTVHTIETSRQPHQQNPTYFPSDPSAYHNESFPQYGQYDIHPSGFCNQAMGPHWPLHGCPNPSSYSPEEQPYQQNAYNPFHKPTVQPGNCYSNKMSMMEDINSRVAQNLAESEGQGGITVRPRYLQTISTVQSERLKQFNVCSQATWSSETKRRRRQRWKLNRQKRKLQQQEAEKAALKAKLQLVDVIELDTPDEETPPPREAKIKTNLSIKLELAKKKLPLQRDSNSCQSHLDLTTD